MNESNHFQAFRILCIRLKCRCYTSSYITLHDGGAETRAKVVKMMRKGVEVNWHEFLKVFRFSQKVDIGERFIKFIRQCHMAVISLTFSRFKNCFEKMLIKPVTYLYHSSIVNKLVLNIYSYFPRIIRISFSKVTPPRIQKCTQKDRQYC